MKISLAFLRAFFLLLTLFFMTAFMVSLPIGSTWQKVLLGIGTGLAFSFFLLTVEMLFRRYHLKAFNVVVVGLFAGYLLGLALSMISGAILTLSHMEMALQPQTIDLIKVCAFLVGTYLGTLLTLHFSDEILFSIPFIKLSPSEERKKDLLIDLTALNDSRILDLAATGLIDHMLIIPSFLLKELTIQTESPDEAVKTRAKRCLETYKKLETMPSLCLRYEEASFPGMYDSFKKLLRLARMIDANLLTANLSPAQIPPVEGIKIINLHSLSNALKPLMDAGEQIKIKIQRFGKEANQGVGYLDDGTMVVVNGGGDYIGETIEVQVLSVKHTTSGRMIFCNTMDDIPARANRIQV